MVLKLLNSICRGWTLLVRVCFHCNGGELLRERKSTLGGRWLGGGIDGSLGGEDLADSGF
jgi:hypothetical protein